MRQAGGLQSTAIPAKKTRPRTATGTGPMCDQALVVTFWQLIAPVSGQAKVVAAVKCSKVR